MPISREEFNQRRVDLTLPVAGLLESRADLAFTADEVQMILLESSGRNATLEEVRQSLEDLVSSGQVQAAEFEGYRWYNFYVVERRLGFLREQE